VGAARKVCGSQQQLELLRRDTGWVGPRNPLGRVIRYLRACAPLLVNYAARRRNQRPISSAGAESAVDFVVGQRMKRNGHMRWTTVGANALLQVRCGVLNVQDVRNFKRWYPPDAHIARLQRPNRSVVGSAPGLGHSPAHPDTGRVPCAFPTVADVNGEWHDAISLFLCQFRRTKQSRHSLRHPSPQVAVALE
jgi:hypothetical protein